MSEEFERDVIEKLAHLDEAVNGEGGLMKRMKRIEAKLNGFGDPNPRNHQAMSALGGGIGAVLGIISILALRMLGVI